MIILYSNHCVRCDILKKKLDEKHIAYRLVDDTEELIAAGLMDAFFPILEVDGKKLSYLEANTFVNSYTEG